DSLREGIRRQDTDLRDKGQSARARKSRPTRMAGSTGRKYGLPESCWPQNTTFKMPTHGVRLQNMKLRRLEWNRAPRATFARCADVRYATELSPDAILKATATLSFSFL